MTSLATTDTALDWDAHYTPGFRARCHLAGLHLNEKGEPDPGICAADEYPDEWVKLIREHAHIQDAARVVENRYQQDTNHGGAVTAVAGHIRDAGRTALTELWESVCEKYIWDTLEKNRAPWDCPFCGTDVPEDSLDYGVVDGDRCPECMCILRERDDEKGWQ
jgi:hypothetical protein